jgi:cytochrome c biogenesis protein CcdA
MTSRQRTLSILIGVIGAIGSCVALVSFMLKIRRNELEVPNTATAQSLYQSVGTAFGDGFVAGFSLCFFLTLLAVAIGTWFESRRDASAKRTGSVRIRLVEKAPRG